MLDPISDMLTRIRNAVRAGHADVLIPASKFKMRIAEILLRKNFISKAMLEEEGTKKQIRIVLKYMPGEKGKKAPFIQGIQRVSREGQRIYVPKSKIPVTRSGYGFSVISTSRGLLTDQEAKKAGLGGEVICEIW